MGLMNTQPLQNYADITNNQNYNRLFPDRNSAISLQIGGGNYNQYSNKQKYRFSQKAKNRSGVQSKLFLGANNIDNYNIRYTQYQNIYANMNNGPIKAIQKKNEKFTNNKISTMEELARGRKEHKRQMSGKRKTYSQNSKRPTSPKASTFYGPFTAIEKPSYNGNFAISNLHQSLLKTDLFNIVEKVYANPNPNKHKNNSKRLGSKKQMRIR